MNCNVVGDFSINCKISFIQNKINHFQLVRSYSYYEWQLLRKINIGPALLETKLENAKSNNSLVSTAISFHCYSLWWGICSILVSLFSCKYIMHTVYTHAKKFSRKKHSGNIQTFLQIVRIPNDYFRLRNMDKHLDNKFEFLSLKSVSSSELIYKICGIMKIYPIQISLGLFLFATRRRQTVCTTDHKIHIIWRQHRNMLSSNFVNSNVSFLQLPSRTSFQLRLLVNTSHVNMLLGTRIQQCTLG